MKYKDLKDVLNSLSNEELEQDVQWAAEGRAGKEVSIWITKEDMINPSGDGCEPISVYLNNPEDMEDDFDPYAETVVYKKGTVIVLID